ncbi:MAG TPA: ABC transporter ATP-binding protein, partial [Syntrophales bacterium]|nr:ABC transporter ATP-binding protein [Syntrophales bacterium]
ILSFVVAFFEGLATFAIYPVLSLVAPASGGSGQNHYLDAIMTWIVSHSAASPLYMAVALLFGLTFFKLILSYGNILLTWVTANKIYQETQIKMMSSLLTTDYQFLLSAQKGDLAYRVLTAPGYVSKITNVMPMMAVELLKTIMLITMLFFISARITTVLIVVAALYFLLARFIARNVSYGTGSGRAQSASNQSVHAMNALKGIKIIRLFGVTKFWADLFGKECKDFYIFARKDAAISGIPNMLLELVTIAFICAMALYFTANGSSFLSNVPVIGVFAYSLLKLMPSLKQMSSYGMEVMAMLPHAEAAYHAIDESDRHQEGSNGREKLIAFSTRIQIKDVTFYYANTDKPAVKNVSADIPKGQFVGIIGPSGSGKTTLLDLLAGLLNVSSGEILLDGKPLGSFSPETLSEHFGYVGQDPFLLNDTIRNNVLFGRNDPGDEIIKQALRKADVLDFVESLPGVLDYRVADDGMKMSGGQRQRICIARALLKNPEILLLDEATSALDHKTEEKIVETIMRIVKEAGNAVIFVTHRKSAIQRADQIIEMKDGQILKFLKSPGENPVSA